jgi:hypothetical protein
MSLIGKLGGTSVFYNVYLPTFLVLLKRKIAKVHVFALPCLSARLSHVTIPEKLYHIHQM